MLCSRNISIDFENTIAFITHSKTEEDSIILLVCVRSVSCKELGGLPWAPISADGLTLKTLLI